MNKFWIPALIASATFSAGALARGWDDDDYRHRDGHHSRHVERVVVHPVYPPPQVVHYAPPPRVIHHVPPARVVYQERVVYRPAPVYYQAAPVRYAPPPRHRSDPDDRVAGQVLGAIAGGVIGNQIGRGDGRVVATAVGAVVGAVVGGNIASH